MAHCNFCAKEISSLIEPMVCEKHIAELKGKLAIRQETIDRFVRIAETQQQELSEAKDKLHRRNMQIKDLQKKVKDYGIGHLSINDLTSNAISFLKKQGYMVKEGKPERCINDIVREQQENV